MIKIKPNNQLRKKRCIYFLFHIVVSSWILSHIWPVEVTRNQIPAAERTPHTKFTAAVPKIISATLIKIKINTQLCCSRLVCPTNNTV